MSSNVQSNSIISVLSNRLNADSLTGFYWFCIVVALTAFYVFPAYYFPLIDMDEGAYAAVSREMVLTGSWLTTMLNGEPFFHKPALMYWTQSIGLLIFGEERFSYRFPSLVAFAFWLMATYQFTKRFLDTETAHAFLWISLFSIGVLISLKAAIPDAWLILFISLGIYKGYEFIVEDQERALMWAFVWTGFGILAKGPIALVVVAGTLFFYLLAEKNGRLLIRAMFFWKGWVLLLLVVLPWYLLQVYLFGQQFLDEFFGKHNVGRFMNAMESHNGNVLYYVVDLMFLTLPFLPILFKSFIPWFKDAKQSNVNRMMLIWFLLVFVFFTVAATKLPHYLMYGVPPVLIMMAYYFKRMNIKWGLGMTLVVWGALLVALPQLIEMAAENEKDPYHFATLHQASLYLPALYYWLVGLMIVVGLILMFAKWDKMVKLFIAGLISATTFSYGLFAYAVNLQQEPIIGAANYVKQHNLTVVTCCIEMPSFNVEAQQLTPMRKPQEGEIAFGKRHEIEAHFAQVEWLYVNRGVAVAKIIEE